MKINIEASDILLTIMEDCGDYTNTIETFRLEISAIPSVGDVLTTTGYFDMLKVIKREFNFEKGKLYSVKVICEKN